MPATAHHEVTADGSMAVGRIVPQPDRDPGIPVNLGSTTPTSGTARPATPATSRARSRSHARCYCCGWRAAVVVCGVRGDQQVVEFGDGVDLWHGDAVVAAEPAALTLHAALLVGPSAPGS